MDRPWRFWIDRGGTFTDVVALRPDGTRLTAKMLSEDPRYPDAVVAGNVETSQVVTDALFGAPGATAAAPRRSFRQATCS